jgi:hypothetical protein
MRLVPHLVAHVDLAVADGFSASSQAKFEDALAAVIRSARKNRPFDTVEKSHCVVCVAGGCDEGGGVRSLAVKAEADDPNLDGVLSACEFCDGSSDIFETLVATSGDDHESPAAARVPEIGGRRNDGANQRPLPSRVKVGRSFAQGLGIDGTDRDDEFGVFARTFRPAIRSAPDDSEPDLRRFPVPSGRHGDLVESLPDGHQAGFSRTEALPHGGRVVEHDLNTIGGSSGPGCGNENEGHES